MGMAHMQANQHPIHTMAGPFRIEMETGDGKTFHAIW